MIRDYLSQVLTEYWPKTNLLLTLANPCTSNPCLNSAVCLETIDDNYECFCRGDFSGPRCEGLTDTDFDKAYLTIISLQLTCRILNEQDIWSSGCRILSYTKTGRVIWQTLKLRNLFTQRVENTCFCGRYDTNFASDMKPFSYQKELWLFTDYSV